MLDTDTIIAQAGSFLAKETVKLCKADLFGFRCEADFQKLILDYITLSSLGCGFNGLTDDQIQCLLGKLNKIEDINDKDTNYLLQEDGSFLLQENGGLIILDK